jgi:DNA transposition AAA+ family ATPase
MSIPGDIVNRATSDLDDEKRSLIRWFHSHCMEHNLSLVESGKLIRYDDSTVHKIFNGRYEGNLDNVCKEISDLKHLVEERSAGRRLDFVVTKGVQRIWKLCDAALEYQRIGFIIGDSQTGKTTALLQYQQDHNHGSTVYVRCPVNPSMAMFLDQFARVLRISTQYTQQEIRRRIISSFDDRMLLIVDEVHQCLSARMMTAAARPIEFVRELFDEAHCGVILCGTPVFDEAMERGAFAGILKQCKRRRICKAMLPATPAPEDMNLFSAAYGLEPATGEALKLQTDILHEEALGMWLTLLRMAAKSAHKSGKRMTWDHVRRAYLGLRALETEGGL